MTPIVIVCGNAGAGKDAFSNFLAENTNGVCLAQADPLKRFAAKVFGFTEEQLWGPSEMRNRVDERFWSPGLWDEVAVNLNRCVESWVNELGWSPYSVKKVMDWGEQLERSCLEESLKLNPRVVLQTLGTEVGRRIDPNTWNRVAIETAKSLLAGNKGYDRTKGLVDNKGAEVDLVIAVDGRFRNEILGVKQAGGMAVKIVSPEETESVGIKGHQSEAELRGIPDSWFDAIVINDKAHGIRALQCLAFEFAQNLRPENRESVYNTLAYLNF
jgi:hypothetical protein